MMGANGVVMMVIVILVEAAEILVEAPGILENLTRPTPITELNSFFHAGYFYSASSSPLLGLYSEALLITAMILCRSQHVEALQTTTSEGLARGAHVAD